MTDKEELAERARKEATGVVEPKVRNLLLDLAQALLPGSSSTCKYCQGAIHISEAGNWFHVSTSIRLCSTTQAEPSER